MNNTHIFISSIHTYIYMKYRLIDRDICTHLKPNYTYIYINVNTKYIPIYIRQQARYVDYIFNNFCLGLISFRILVLGMENNCLQLDFIYVGVPRVCLASVIFE